MKPSIVKSSAGRYTSLAAFTLFSSAFLAAQTNAAVIINNATVNSEAGGFGYEAESFTIPSGTAFNNITFSWIAFSGAPTAAGDLFLMSQPYFGSPANLSVATPGFVGHATTISQSAYVFSPAMSLSAGSMYWAYMGDDAAISGTGYDALGGYSGGKAYESFGDSASTANYGVTQTDVDYAFRLQGSAVPEPSAASLSVFGLLGLCFRRFRNECNA